MKKNILAICALAAAATVCAQDYQVVVTTTDGERKVFATKEVTDISFTNAPEYQKANTLIEARYSPLTSNAQYDITIGTEEPDNEGQPSAIGGLQLSLSMYAELSEEAQNAMLPEGYYRVGSGSSSGTISASGSAIWIRFGEGSDEVAVGYVVGGTADVRHDGDNYDIRAEIDLLDGSHADVSYYGPIKFSVGASGAGNFDQDQDIAFTVGQGRVWANWFNPFCDDGSLQFFTGSFDNNGSQTEGFYLYVPYYMPKDDAHTSTWSPVITDGTYTVDPREIVSSQTYRPFTVQHGGMLDIFGTTTPTGTYITYLAADGRVSLATIAEGSMTVSDNGTKFVFDFVSDKGIHFTGTFNQKPYVVNYIDNSNKPEYPDNLTGDYQLTKFPKDAVIVDYNMGDYIVPGINSHIVMFTDIDQAEGDYLSLDLLSEGEQIKDGVYTIDNSLTEFSGIKGGVSYQGNIIFSWYGDLDSTDEEGYQTILAPIWGGTVTVSTLDNGNRKFDFDLRDMKGNKITGSIDRDVHYASEETTTSAKVERAHRRALGCVKRTWSSHREAAAPQKLMLRK